jgi:hypothetical protein
MVTKTKSIDDNYVRMYYEHQYERMAKLEEQRLSMTNYVLTISALAFTFGFKDQTFITVINGIGLPLVIIVANLFAIVYIDRSGKFLYLHRKRAHEILKNFAPELDAYNEKYSDPKKGIFGGRTKIQKLLHILLILLALIPLGIYLAQFV